MNKAVPHAIGEWIAASRGLAFAVPNAIAVVHVDLSASELRELFSGDVVERIHVRDGESRLVAYAAMRHGGVTVEVWGRTESREPTSDELRALSESQRDVLVLDCAKRLDSADKVPIRRISAEGGDQ